MIRLKNISEKNEHGKFICSSSTHSSFSKKTDDLSVKIVLSGIEDYKVNGNRYKLGIDKYLIVDRASNLDLTIDDKNGVDGICIFPKHHLVHDIFRFGNASCEDLLTNPFIEKDFNILENTFSFKENRLGNFLSRNIPYIIKDHNRKKDIDFDSFYTVLIECLAIDQLELQRKLKNLTSIKKSTKVELYRRIANAKDFIDDNYTKRINIDELAKNVFLSKYHFLRSFKAYYDKSPYQYILKLRLEKAQELLNKDYSFRETCDLVGFSDEKNLRKALKKQAIPYLD
ncbi:helix-turn-helix domain-containing protein [uncultured Allomuricauda sp.]|uniref:helix-turn-helix domain-containing protein n=1 Tax=Flagellimonas sp. W118 TaxID=3410791 RepID=UPI002606C378|nr:AraC family transcriptional regulator [uncultured Allomuricauda sp.]